MMTELGCSIVNPTESEGDFDEFDHVPLVSRRKLLLASKRTSMFRVDIAVKKEEEDDQGLLSFPSARSVRQEIDQPFALKQNHDSEVPSSELSCGEILEDSSAFDQSLQAARRHQDVGMPGDCNSQKIHINLYQKIHINSYICPDQITCTGLNADVPGLNNGDVSFCTLYKNSVLSSVPAKVKVEDSENNGLNLVDEVNTGANLSASKVNNNTQNDAGDDLDHIVLKERQRMLVQRQLLEWSKHAIEGSSVGLSEDLIDPSAGSIKEETQSVDMESMVTETDHNEIPQRISSDLGISSTNGLSNISIAGLSFTAKQNSEIPGNNLGTEATKLKRNREKSDTCFSETTLVEFNSYNGQHDVPDSGSKHVSAVQASIKVKVEPSQSGDLHRPEKNVLSSCSFNTQPVKREMEIRNELHSDWLDHMILQDRLKLRTSGEASDLNSSCNFEYSSKTASPSLQYSPTVSESAKPIRVNRPWKRKKTATDSVETALEEDAPGLLRVLVDQGISVDEIKLYGEMESDEALDETFDEDSIAEFEAVMSKLFFQRTSLLKFASARCTKGSKPSYCLGCLFSLVEQTRYLQFRKWPVEWGWCRDLQSFIFVFKSHHRIVMERPEYGYATYFFELVDSLSIGWQIKRLVTCMKLTNCGRVNLIENKSLSVGEDLSEGEAKVLMKFGWIPNCGLGTMLNYCDRLYHDRQNEKDASEWRAKIGKMLTDGYNGGTLISTSIAEKPFTSTDADSSQIKLEID